MVKSFSNPNAIGHPVFETGRRWQSFWRHQMYGKLVNSGPSEMRSYMVQTLLNDELERQAKYYDKDLRESGLSGSLMAAGIPSGGGGTSGSPAGKQAVQLPQAPSFDNSAVMNSAASTYYDSRPNSKPNSLGNRMQRTSAMKPMARTNLGKLGGGGG